MDHVAALSHKGRRHPHNEDSILTVGLADGSLLLAVADGVGGERAGEVASKEAVRTIEQQVKALAKAPPGERLQAAIRQASAAIWKSSQDNVKLRGMATTTVAAIVAGGQAWLANVGDSRAYLIVDGGITQLTDDHSLVAERVRDGDLTEEEAKESRARHIITRSVGSDEEVEPDLFGPLALPTGSHLLLCSDGLHDVVSDEEIASIVTGNDLAHAAQRLIERANEEGGPDNISVVLYHELGNGATVVAKRDAASLEPPSRYAIAGITTALAVLIGGVAIWATTFNSGGGDAAIRAEARAPSSALAGTHFAELIRRSENILPADLAPVDIEAAIPNSEPPVAGEDAEPEAPAAPDPAEDLPLATQPTLAPPPETPTAVAGGPIPPAETPTATPTSTQAATPSSSNPVE